MRGIANTLYLNVKFGNSWYYCTKPASKSPTSSINILLKNPTARKGLKLQVEMVFSSSRGDFVPSQLPGTFPLQFILKVLNLR